MLTTAYVDGVKITITDFRKDLGKEPVCSMGHRLVAKKGKKVVHHFAHYASQACDSWRTGMTNWHAQWQKIVLDPLNLEACLDADGKILGYSSFTGTGMQSHNASQGHIADIIKPRIINGNFIRPSVVEIQHSSIDKKSIEDREAYYKDMIWVFDLTPRIVAKGKHTKIVFVDGCISYQKEKVNYVALISCTNRQITIGHRPSESDHNLIIPSQTFDQFESMLSNNSTGLDMKNVFIAGETFRGDECLSQDLTPIQGVFIIINTRTKYWYDTKSPTYFDCGFGILRLIKKLDKGFALTLYMSYEEFIKERMPPVNLETVSKCQWFNSITPAELVPLKIMPVMIDVGSISICRNRVVIKHDGTALSELGLERGYDDWHWGEYYTVAKEHIPNSNVDSNLMQNLMRQATIGMITTQVGSANSGHIEAGLIMKVRAYLKASNSLDIQIINMRGVDTLIVYCNKETVQMKDKFKAMGMTYRRGAGKEKSVSSRQSAKQTDAAINSMIKNRQAGGNAATLKTLKDREERDEKESRHSWHISVSKLASFFSA